MPTTKGILTPSSLTAMASTARNLSHPWQKKWKKAMTSSLEAVSWTVKKTIPCGSRLITSAIRLTTGVTVTDPTSGMRMFNREMIREFALNINYGPEPDTVSYLLKQGAKIAEVPVRIAERAGGESYLKPVVAVRYMARILISILLIQNFRKRRKG